jgi:hypothetical protein
MQYSSTTLLPTTKCWSPFIPACICPTLQYKLPQKNENYYNKLFILILAHLFSVNLNINCCYAILSTGTTLVLLYFQWAIPLVLVNQRQAHVNSTVPLGCTEGGEFLKQMSGYQPLKKDSVP